MSVGPSNGVGRSVEPAVDTTETLEKNLIIARPKTRQVGPMSCAAHVGRKTLEISAAWRSGTISDELGLWCRWPLVVAAVAS
jgi:hypothetical protein